MTREFDWSKPYNLIPKVTGSDTVGAVFAAIPSNQQRGQAKVWLQRELMTRITARVEAARKELGAPALDSKYMLETIDFQENHWVVHCSFHPMPRSVRRRGQTVLCKFTVVTVNEYQDIAASLKGGE